uniref:Ubiquinol oxidase n=1 Tax=Fagus sylvatica TaxID=28930 RepID=A0A2N9EQN8_FAGSY
MIATTLSSTAFTISASPLKANSNYNNSASFYSQNPFLYNPLSTRPSISRKSCRVRATVLKENEEKVVVEESFPTKTSPNDGGKGSGGDNEPPPESSSSGVVEKWVIKFEQSVNVFLTDTVIKILDTLYHDRDYPRFFVLETIARVPYFDHFSECVEGHAFETYDKLPRQYPSAPRAAGKLPQGFVLVVIGSTHGGRALWVLAGEDSPGQAWGNRTRGSHRDKTLRKLPLPKRTICCEGDCHKGYLPIPKRVFCNIPGSDTLEYYSILSSLGLAPSRLCPRVIHMVLGLVPSPASTHEARPPCVEPMTLKVIGSTHGGRALWVLAGEDSPGQAWGNRTRGSHRDKTLRKLPLPKRTICCEGDCHKGYLPIPKRVFCNIPGSDTLEYYSILSSLGLAPSRLCPRVIHMVLGLVPSPASTHEARPPCVEPMTLKVSEPGMLHKTSWVRSPLEASLNHPIYVASRWNRVSRVDYPRVHAKGLALELGGNAWWVDRFLAQHIAIAYYIMTVLMYTLSPRMAYHFSECVEGHAFETYDKFIKSQGDELKKLPAPEVAVKYYTGGDFYLFDEFQSARAPNSRRPKIENLYDVFLNIRDDEAEHCKTMRACQTHGNLRSPHSIPDGASEDDTSCVLPQTDCEGIVDCLKKSVTSPPANEDI